MKKYLKCVLVLTVICAVVAVLLAAANSITEPIIEKNEAAAANQALLVVMPDGGEFENVDISAYTLPQSVTEVFSASNGGYVIKLNVAGFNPGMVIMCGVSADGVVTGATCLTSGETLGHEKTYGDKTVGATVDTVDAIETIAGATKTTAGYKNAVKDALNSAIILGGGSVDIRTDAEILADNLSAAMPSANGEFTKVFIAEKLEGVSAIYDANNGEGSVYVIGETFVAVDKDNNVISEATEEEKAIASAAAEIMAAFSTEDIDITAYENMPAAILSAKKTASGNFIFDVKASGYGINGKYNASGLPIYIKVSVSADGEIITCETVSQSETDGIGSACADPAFYSQFDGKTVENYKEIDAIAKATVTTNGYTTAILRVFEAANILKGEA